MVESVALRDCIRISWIMLQLTNDPHSSVTYCKSLFVSRAASSAGSSISPKQPPSWDASVRYSSLIWWLYHLNRRPLHSPQQDKSYFRQRELRVFHYFSPEIICEFSFTFHWTKLVVRLHLTGIGVVSVVSHMPGKEEFDIGKHGWCPPQPKVYSMMEQRWDSHYSDIWTW